jgi:hypothetical protein
MSECVLCEVGSPNSLSASLQRSLVSSEAGLGTRTRARARARTHARTRARAHCDTHTCTMSSKVGLYLKVGNVGRPPAERPATHCEETPSTLRERVRARTSERLQSQTQTKRKYARSRANTWGTASGEERGYWASWGRNRLLCGPGASVSE